MTQEPHRDVDLYTLVALDPWSPEWRRAMERQFPSTTRLHWERAFARHPELLGRLLRDILKAEKREPGRHGPRPGLNEVFDAAALDRLRGLDPSRHAYSRLPFAKAFSLLIEGHSVRGAARRLGMASARVQRLKTGDAIPTLAEMETIAERYGHHPGYFLEYRVWSFQVVVGAQLAGEPDMSIQVYERIWQWAGGSGRTT